MSGRKPSPSGSSLRRRLTRVRQELDTIVGELESANHSGKRGREGGEGDGPCGKCRRLEHQCERLRVENAQLRASVRQREPPPESLENTMPGAHDLDNSNPNQSLVHEWEKSSFAATPVSSGSPPEYQPSLALPSSPLSVPRPVAAAKPNPNNKQAKAGESLSGSDDSLFNSNNASPPPLASPNKQGSPPTTPSFLQRLTQHTTRRGGSGGGEDALSPGAPPLAGWGVDAPLADHGADVVSTPPDTFYPESRPQPGVGRHAAPSARGDASHAGSKPASASLLPSLVGGGGGGGGDGGVSPLSSQQPRRVLSPSPVKAKQQAGGKGRKGDSPRGSGVKSDALKGVCAVVLDQGVGSRMWEAMRRIVHERGGTVQDAVDKSTTHIVAAVGLARVKSLVDARHLKRRRNPIHLVSCEWLTSSAATNARAEEAKFPLVDATPVVSEPHVLSDAPVRLHAVGGGVGGARGQDDDDDVGGGGGGAGELPRSVANMPSRWRALLQRVMRVKEERASASRPPPPPTPQQGVADWDVVAWTFGDAHRVCARYSPSHTVLQCCFCANQSVACQLSKTGADACGGNVFEYLDLFDDVWSELKSVVQSNRHAFFRKVVKESGYRIVVVPRDSL